MTLTPSELDGYFADGMDDGDIEAIAIAIGVFKRINPIVFTKYLASINKSDKTNVEIAKAVYAFGGAYYNSLNPEAFKNSLNSIPPRWGTAQEIANATKLDHRRIGQIIKGLGIKKKDGYYSNDDVATITDVYTNKAYGKSIPIRIKTYQKIKNMGLQFISQKDLQIRLNKKLKELNDKTGIFDLD